jgi:hypothetical protein
MSSLSGWRLYSGLYAVSLIIAFFIPGGSPGKYEAAGDFIPRYLGLATGMLLGVLALSGIINVVRGKRFWNPSPIISVALLVLLAIANYQR